MTASDAAADLLVFGAGAGGMCAALAAAHQGLRVLLCEATGQVGGTTATSAGTVWLPGNRQGAEAGHGDSLDLAARYLDGLLGEADPGDLRRRYLVNGARLMADIERLTRVRFVSAGLHPDYVEAPGRALAGRALSPVEFDGRLLGADDFRRVRPPLPELMVLGGMMANKADVQALFQRWRSRRGFVRTAQLVARYLLDRVGYPRGTRLVLGNALVARLLASLRDAGVEVRFGHRLLEVERTGDVVTGAVCEHEGQRLRLSATRGVVLATGGIGHDEMLRQEMASGAPHRFSLACDSVRGDGLSAARAVGARLERHPQDFLWQPVSQVRRTDGSTGLFPHLYLDRAKPGLIAVGRDGRRFVDEGCSYHHFVEAQRRALGLNEPAWLVCDSDFFALYGLGPLPPGRLASADRAGRYLVVSPTLAALAERIGIDVDGLEDTVAQNNEAARLGHDAAFHKGETAVCRFNGDAARGANPCLGPIASGPFCAVAVWPADAASSSGLATDADGAVLDRAGRVIEGLYACGNDMASVMRGAYPGPGTTLGPAMVFGWCAGLHAAGRAGKWAGHATKSSNSLSTGIAV